MPSTESLLILGSGGREHALAWKFEQSHRVKRIFVARGNGGTAGVLNGGNVSLSECDGAAILAFVRAEAIGLVVVGPEVPLAAGIVDTLRSAGVRCFGPSQAAARLETSKDFSKAFMRRHAIPTGDYASFTDFEQARAYLDRVPYEVVIKAAGLAAGKGVILPEDRREAESALHQIMVERVFGAAGDTVVIEERLVGPEASVLAFCDGSTVVPMPPAQDHKRALDGDRGPNTGGMGAYAPATIVTPEMLAEVQRTVLQPALDGMRSEGTPYVGVLYAGLMLTEAGIKVLEFNCRFGDPETQVILPLLASDLFDVCDACVEGRLAATEVRWHPGSAATVVAASAGYPGSYSTGKEIHGVDAAMVSPGVVVFQAGTTRDSSGTLRTSGGRVLSVTGMGKNLGDALQRAYSGIAQISFEGMHYRRDIGAKGLATPELTH